MTKKVRIENADTSTYKVRVQTWAKGVEGAPDTLQKEEVLPYPASMGDFYIHSTQYVVILELPADALDAKTA